jgi:hypothetical protein
MVEVLEKVESLKKKSGRPHTLDLEDLVVINSQLLTELQHSTGIGGKLPYR